MGVKLGHAAGKVGMQAGVVHRRPPASMCRMNETKSAMKVGH